MSSNSFNVLITGANRGIGFGLVKQFLSLPDVTLLFAGVRKPSEAKVTFFPRVHYIQNLHAISDRRLRIIQLEVTDDTSIQKAFKEVNTAVGAAGLHLLVNNAGILHDYPFEVPNRQLATEVLNVNTISPLIVAQTFLPLLRRASEVNSSRPLGARRAAIINISSQLGSIGLNTFGSLVPSGQHALAYRASKSALNAISKSLSHDLKKDKILVISQCPGWVKTDMGTQNAFLTPEESTSSLLKQFLSYGEKDNGFFYSHDGQRYEF